MYQKIDKCRICGNENLITIMNLGNQYLTGVFPKNKNQIITSGPLKLVKCFSAKDRNVCGLVQLGHFFSPNEMYGDNYGYRSGINKSMVKHLHNKVKNIQKLTKLRSDDLIIDIGSNDSTLLQGYPRDDFILAGIDPTGKKFREYYPNHIKLIPDFFSKELVGNSFGAKKAKVVTSIAMFYDLEAPMDFMKDIYDILADDGVWVFEQSYLPAMLKMNAYDTICHEHSEYYCLEQIKWMVDKIGFKILDIELNNINGGSFSVTVAKANSAYNENKSLVDSILLEEKNKGLNKLSPYEDFKSRVYKHREILVEFIQKIKGEGKKIFGYGASTKGNVILQFCSLTEKDIPFIAEVNSDKFGCYTPGTYIPIISEDDAKIKSPDYFMVLPWHFEDNIVAREHDFLAKGGKLFFPLPNLKIIKI